MDMVGWASCRKHTTYNDILYRSAIPSRKTTRDEANKGTGPFRTTSRLITLPEALTTFGYIVNYMGLLFTCSLLERRICGGHFRCQKSQNFIWINVIHTSSSDFIPAASVSRDVHTPDIYLHRRPPYKCMMACQLDG